MGYDMRAVLSLLLLCDAAAKSDDFLLESPAQTVRTYSLEVEHVEPLLSHLWSTYDSSSEAVQRQFQHLPLEKINSLLHIAASDRPAHRINCQVTVSDGAAVSVQAAGHEIPLPNIRQFERALRWAMHGRVPHMSVRGPLTEPAQDKLLKADLSALSLEMGGMDEKQLERHGVQEGADKQCDKFDDPDKPTCKCEVVTCCEGYTCAGQVTDSAVKHCVPNELVAKNPQDYTTCSFVSSGTEDRSATFFVAVGLTTGVGVASTIMGGLMLGSNAWAVGIALMILGILLIILPFFLWPWRRLKIDQQRMDPACSHARGACRHKDEDMPDHGHAPKPWHPDWQPDVKWCKTYCYHVNDYSKACTGKDAADDGSCNMKCKPILGTVQAAVGAQPVGQCTSVTGDQVGASDLQQGLQRPTFSWCESRCLFEEASNVCMGRQGADDSMCLQCEPSIVNGKPTRKCM